jgi:hypothetical protein
MASKFPEFPFDLTAVGEGQRRIRSPQHVQSIHLVVNRDLSGNWREKVDEI